MHAMDIGSRAAVAGAATAVLLALAGPAEAQDRSFLKLDARAGVAVPTGELGDFTDPGFSWGLGAGILVGPRLALRGDLDVSYLSQLEGEDQVDDFFEADVTLWHYGGGLELGLTDPEVSPVSFTLGLGAGATRIDPAEPDVGAELESFTRFTANGSVGLGTNVSDNLTLFARGRAYMIFLQDEDRAEDFEDEIEDTWWIFPLQVGLELRVP